MKKRNLIYSFTLIVSLLLSSCLITTENKKQTKETESSEKHEYSSSNKKQGWVEYELRLELPSDKDDNMLEGIIKGAVEGLVEHLDPRFTVKFKNEYARIDFDKVHFMHNEFQFDDSIHSTFRLFDFGKMKVTDFESDENEERSAVYQDIDEEKYEIEETDQHKEILGFDCQKVYLIDPFDEDTIIIWYTSDIEIPLSPFEYVPVDGLSLEMIVEGVVMRAVQVSFEEMEDELFVVPDDIPLRRKSEHSNSQREI
ncbi:MAG: hypothetical protein K9H64_02035 [Bacteroidales bacterium]|nr:hypothetical protein [Bacteroidales bacterium]MCF8454674.1 hypothetical protein [Bacteroidales bacterium]